VKALLMVAALVGACSPTQQEAEPTSMPAMDAGASCSTMCRNLDDTLHCTDFWPADSTCLKQCNGLTARLDVPHTLSCRSKASSCKAAHLCKE
jgi:hypothetical protein